MKSIFAGIGFLVIAVLVFSALSRSGAIRSTYDYFSQPQGCADGGCEIQRDQVGYEVPMPHRGMETSFNYESRRGTGYGNQGYGQYGQQGYPQRQWVQPQYRTVFQRGIRQTIQVRPGYWREAPPQTSSFKEKKIGFDFGGLLAGFGR